MSGRRDESLLLDDMVKAASRLVDLGSGEDTVLGEGRPCDEQVLYNLIVTGEIAKRVSPETRSRFPQIPWSAMARARDRVVHHYEGIDWMVIGQIVTSDLPSLLPQLMEIRDIVRTEFDAGTRG